MQGVWFRASAAREAESRGVAGCARNQRDGSVLLALEGPAATVDALIAWCRLGPPRAEVAAVSVETLEPLGATTFRTE